MRTLTVDTWALVEYFGGNPVLKRFIEENSLLTPSLVLSEFTRSLLIKGKTLEEIDNWTEFIKLKSTILPLDSSNAREAGILCFQEKLPMADGIIYSYANENSFLLTGDPHLKGKKFVEYIN